MALADANPRRRRRRGYHPRFETRLFLLALGAGLLPLTAALLILWEGDYRPIVRWTLVVVMVLPWLGFALAVRQAVVRPLQTLANMHAAVREGDFTMRARADRLDDALGELLYESNQLSNSLREQRLGAMETTALLRTVMAELDVAIFTFDGDSRLRLINRAGEALLGRPAERLLGLKAEELALQELLEGESARTFDHAFPGRSARWGLRRTVFRQGGARQHLVVLADLSRALREEERQAWQRLLRVLGHELNNSLAPIKSIADSLETMVRRPTRHADWEDDLRRGLEVISSRSDSLARFINQYSRLARLPQPNLQPVSVAPLLQRIVSLEQRLPVELQPGPELTVQADPDQLEQVVINALKNAVEAALDTGGGVCVQWCSNGSYWELLVRDEGAGIANPANLFVPFFSTKQGGSGIGLVLSRQIAEAHGGNVSLRNRDDRTGGEFRLQLPIDPKGE